MNHLLQRFRRDIGGLVWGAAGLFIGLALYSYSPADPSFNSLANNTNAQNYCGYFGSFLADLLYQGFGVSAWILVLACFRMSHLAFGGQLKKFEKLRLLWAALLVLTTAALLGLHQPGVKVFFDQILVGGVIGHMISQGLTKVFNFVGVAVILWTTATVLLVFYTEKTLKELFKWPLAGISASTEKINQVPVADGFSRFWTLLKDAFRVLIPERRGLAFESGSSMATNEAPEPARKFVLKDRKSKTSSQEFLPLDEDMEEDVEEALPEDPEPVVDIKGFFSRSQKQGPKKKKKKVKIPTRIENWNMPEISMLEDPPPVGTKLDEREIKAKSRLLVDKLAQFSVRGEVVGIKPGPAVTMFEFKPAADVKISKIVDLADDLSLALSSESVRIIAPIPGRDVVGIETSNSARDTVYLKDVLEHEPFWNEDIKLPLALGRQADGEPKIVDLRKMPHLLVAGTTGSGKSVFVVSALTGLLFRHSPKTLKLILVDPKQVDLAAFNNLPHLIMPPVREPKKAVGALRWAIKEMEKRYRSMSKFGARGIEEFNAKMEKLSKDKVEEHAQVNEELEGVAKLESYYYTPQPYICIVVEEFGDLMAVDKSNVEQSVVRLAQMARACGIHLILAMQSPRKDVVTGLIKTNIPGRISFKVASKMDSRIILDEAGAERLLARGDMLFLAPGVAKPQRHHGAYLKEEEIENVVASWKDQGEADYDPIALKAIEGSGGGFDLDGDVSEDDFQDEKDERYDEILAYVAGMKEVSASLLQRKFRLGYPRAARMIEIFESEGVVGPANGSKPRQVLVRDLKEL